MAAARSALPLLAAAALLCAVAVAAAPSGGTLTQAQLRAMFFNNLRRFQAFPCDKPQRRSVAVGELLQRAHQLEPSKTISPPATVLHRCEPSTGCCFSADKVCAPAETQTVTLSFQVLDAVRGSDFTSMSINFVNHTRCECLPRAEADSTEEVVWETNSVP